MLIINLSARANTANNAVYSERMPDSTGIRVISDKKNLRTRHRYDINIFINKVLFKSDARPENGFIYIPDSFTQNDKIKITVKPSGSGQKWTNQIVKSKTYKFRYSKSNNIAVKIQYKKGFNLFRRKPSGICPANFW